MEILEAVIENKNTEENIEQWTENHRAAVAIYGTTIDAIENRIITLKREIEADKSEQKEFRGDQMKKQESYKCRWR